MIYDAFCAEHGLRVPERLQAALSQGVGEHLAPLLYSPVGGSDQANSLAWALEMLRESVIPPPPNHLPLIPVDDVSIACAVCPSVDHSGRELEDESCEVVRWHLGRIDPQYQGALLDSDAAAFLHSVAEELCARQSGLESVRRRAERYQEQYLDRGVRPRAHNPRPIQLACQNVIVGLAVLQQDPRFDGLRVLDYLTCEAPHLATHEANRAMAALLLCDAFQNGGTMEIRFGERNQEAPVPPALRRYGRSVGLSLGTDDPNAITPEEARDLFLAVTPMPDDLRARSYDLIDRGVISPERLCFTLMSAIWRAFELDYILATSSRVPSILEGGAPPEFRRARLAEVEVCRAALMTGMLLRRLDNADAAAQAADGVRVFEDGSVGVAWTIHEDLGAVAMTEVPEGRLPWAPRGREQLAMTSAGVLIVVPRALPTPFDCQLVQDLRTEHPAATVALLIPSDMLDTVSAEVPVLLCPDRLGELDVEIERNLGKSRTGRA